MTRGITEPGLVSVVMPVRNSERFLAEALGTVVAQTHRRVEVIVVDGGSTDATERIARSFAPVRWLRQSRTGLWNAFNDGIAAARGDFVAFLSDDDLWHEDKLRLQLEALSAQPEAEYAIGRFRFVRIENQPLPAAFRPELLEGDHLGHMPEVLLVRRRLFDVLGVMDEGLEISADIDWLVRAREAAVPCAIVPRVLLYKRIHANNLSSLPASGATLQRELLRIVRAKLAREHARERP